MTTPAPSPDLEPADTVPAADLPRVLAVCAGCREPVVEPDRAYLHCGDRVCGGCLLARVSEDR